jgi:hypothetical protein
MVLRVQQTEGHWEEQSAVGETRTILSAQLANELLSTWHAYGDQIRGFVGIAIAGESLPAHTWFLGATSGDAGDYAVVVLIEHAAETEVAAEIGTALLKAAQTTP